MNGEGERAATVALVEGERGLTRGPEWGYVALSFCIFDTHQRCTSGPSASGMRTVREC